ncbi:hypothetical protein [Escherichia coli]|uniref:hypothetical protein n=1 Tax=Escherichia coli TaxID=562 RepID=UPI000B442D00|nr:hypothetical protein [Escherichia coli]ARZ82675.1 hypothetical protein AM361_06515 [Escherichia coli]
MGSCAAPSAKGDDKFITTDYLQQCPINWVFLGLTGMSVVTISCAVAFIAYKMLVDGKAWHDLQRVFWAGVLLAGASGFGAYFAA